MTSKAFAKSRKGMPVNSFRLMFDSMQVSSQLCKGGMA